MEHYEEAMSIIAAGPKAIKTFEEQFGRLFAFTRDEAKQFKGVLGLIEQYIRQKSPKRPLCVGVFGPPGSGKSFSVVFAYFL